MEDDTGKTIRTDKSVFIVPVKDIVQEKVEPQDATFPDSRIAYGDLVLTLMHDPTKYYRPTIIFLEDQPVVTKNWTFYSAAREANIKKILCDVLEPSTALARGYQLAVFPEPKIFRRFMFFKGSIYLPETPRGARLACHWDESCLEYQSNNPHNSTQDKFREFARAIQARGGKIKSIDGITLQE